MQNIQGLSIIIPSLNEEDNLIKLIDHIKNIHLEKYEIIVVEGGNDSQIRKNFDIKTIIIFYKKCLPSLLRVELDSCIE